MRLGLGAAYGETRVQTDRVSLPDSRVSGPGYAIDVWAGWAVSSGLVLGPLFSVWSTYDGDPKVSGGADSGQAHGAVLGAFVDAHPSSSGGQHFGGALTLGSVKSSLASRPDVEAYDGGGLGFLVFGGYDFWLAKHYGFGGLFKLGALATRASSNIAGQNVERRATAYAASLSLTAFYY
ncbi:MAG: hypothetical protein QM756_26335 [Polyangiaceae bacterium]